MNRDILFLLDPQTVVAEDRARYCPDCALVAGYLSFYPGVARSLDVRYVAPPRPRPDIVALLGEAHQGAPVLILDRAAPVPAGIAVREVNGRRFIDEAKDILGYLGLRFAAGGLPL